jgi:hypothetical protein
MTKPKGKIIEIDTLTDRPKETIPFDNDGIHLKTYIPESYFVKGITLFELDKNGSKMPPRPRIYNALARQIAEESLGTNLQKLRRECKNCKFQKDSKTDIKKCRDEIKVNIATFETDRKKKIEDFKKLVPPFYPSSIVIDDGRKSYPTAKGNQVELYFPIPPLEPAKNYSIELEYYTLTSGSKVIEVLTLARVDVGKAKTKWNSVKGNIPEFSKIEWPSVATFYSSVAQDFTTMYTNRTAMVNSIGTYTLAIDKSRLNVVEDFTKKFVQSPNLRTSFGADPVPTSIYETYKNTLLPFDRLSAFITNGKDFLSGSIPFQSSPFVKKAESAQDSLANVNASIATLSKMSELLTFIRLQNIASATGDYNVLQTQLEAIVNFLKSNVKPVLASIVDTQTEILRNFYSSNLAFSSKSIIATSQIYNFQAKNKFSIVPDFGFVVMYNGGNLVDNSSFVPYAGFNINFRPINKDIPFRELRYKTLLYRLSFMSGITLTSIAIPNKRKDLFASTSLLTGLGFRLTNEVKIIGGTVWFRKNDTNPFSDQYKLGLSPFLGVSIDLELQQLFGGIKNLFTSSL